MQPNSLCKYTENLTDWQNRQLSLTQSQAVKLQPSTGCQQTRPHPKGRERDEPHFTSLFCIDLERLNTQLDKTLWIFYDYEHCLIHKNHSLLKFSFI